MENFIGAQWICLGMIWTLIYGYEALGYSPDPDHCYASDFSNFRVTDLHDKRTDDFVDVGERFSIIFTIAYFSALTIFVMGILHCFNHKHVRIFARAIGTIANNVMGIAVIIGLVFRMIHSGKVCSGDFIADKDSKDGYLITQGFILMLVIYIYIASCCFFVLIGAVAFFLSTS